MMYLLSIYRKIKLPHSSERGRPQETNCETCQMRKDQMCDILLLMFYQVCYELVLYIYLGHTVQSNSITIL